MKRESKFKSDLYKEIRRTYPGSEVLINDANYIQGIPDATVLLPNGKYVLLEGKRHSKASHRPNQDYYVDESPLRDHAFFVSPENKDDILKEIERRYKGEV